MKKQTYQISIHAPANRVYQVMLDKATYKQWTAEFNPTSDFEGSWNKGNKIYFTGINAAGKKEGMVARIAENIPNQFVSIEHLGILDGEKEITEGPMVEEWAGAHENYTFRENMGITMVLVELDISEKYITYFDETWPKALSRLKALCEQ